MKMRHLFVLTVLFTLGLGPVAPSLSLAQRYPDHPIQIVIPNVAGAQMDIAARLLASELRDEEYKQTYEIAVKLGLRKQ